MNTVELEKPPETQPNPGTDLTDDEIKAGLKKYWDLAVANKISLEDAHISVSSAPLGSPDGNGPQNSQAQLMKECMDKFNASVQSTKDQLNAIVGNTATSAAPTGSNNSAPKIDQATETLAKAMFADKAAEIKKIDPDFPVEVISELSGVDTTHKVAILSKLKGLAQSRVDGIAAIKSEFASQTGNNKKQPPVGVSGTGTPAEPAVAHDRIANIASKMGASDLIKTTPPTQTK